MAELKAGVAKAIGEVRAHYAHLEVQVFPSPCGGAFVVVEDVPLGPPYAQETTWVGFFLSSACPDDDTYPFYVRSDLSRIDGAELRPPIHVGRNFPEVPSPMPQRSAVMVSRRQRNQSSWVHESPLLKLRTILKWMLEQ